MMQSSLLAEKKWLLAFSTAAMLSIVLFVSSISSSNPSYYIRNSQKPSATAVRRGDGYPPAFAYYISGEKGDAERIFRLLLAVYHPRNRYLLHIGADGSKDERQKLADLVKSVPAIRGFRNVDVMEKPDPVTYMGSTNVAAALHAAAILLKVDGDWDWFVTLSASDYPLLTQDDLSHVFSSIRRDLNFIDHTSDLGWKEGQRVRPIVVDPGLYSTRRSQIFHATQNRPMPDAFKVFTGSQWITLSRGFMEFCVIGWDNLPRTLLMYFNNAILPQEVYFQSVICNSPEFKNTTVNSDLRYFTWDNPPKMEPLFLKTPDYDQMVQSGAAFARQFHKDDPVLDMVDEKILKRGPNQPSPGVWCTGKRRWWSDSCSKWGNVNVLKPGPQANKFQVSMTSHLDAWTTQSNQCK